MYNNFIDKKNHKITSIKSKGSLKLDLKKQIFNINQINYL